MASERYPRDSSRAFQPRYWPSAGVVPVCAVEVGRVVTSSGTAPTGGEQAGSADRIQPDRSRWIDRSSNETDSVDNEGADPTLPSGLSPSLGGVSGATPPLGTVGSYGAGTTSGEATYPQAGSSGALTGDVGSGMAGEELIDEEERVVR